VHLGILTEPFSNAPVGQAIAWAGASGFEAVEISCRRPAHFDVRQARSGGGLDAVRTQLAAAQVRVSALAYYVNLLDPDLSVRTEAIDTARATVDCAAALKIDTVCLMAGLPMPGKTKLATIAEDAPAVYGPLADYAAARGVRIAFENWFQTNLQGLAHFDAMFSAVPQPNVGLNFDPSHLVHQDIDYIAAVHRYAPRIFHAHAKDVEIRADIRRHVGNRETGWWRYVIPGFGVIPWGPFIGALRSAGYDGVLSIEHEDKAQSREDGFLRGARHLRQYL